ncbi:MAG: PIN domain-containing protein [Candidatus Marinimicrobia bacterium]|jgi:hypothetical protein|nr:PIN domain-containing protein [Candidatus Neomarinimicrobiota bacterium]MBT3677078.1 PIN domain-containing protein [Candidatus Neomarinimicrobiota bacterium]MBT4069487.1 PIN domain-containing protein [Candidatus Neomarinimicrobiota bacterium]MBT4270517.1 PIN domain-containing protein [Candidatus Neomarinimicrobiota bacterium]MBT4372674.1 PIN domain-containing protein [Candidatus Neomarinimicrobiota bacterium]
MKILVDTCIWSLALRRKAISNAHEITRLKELILDSNAIMMGPIRQELLSGISIKSQFNKLKEYLQAFPDLTVLTDDYELAAEYYNIYRAKGIQGSNTDFLICSISTNHELPVFTTDKDFILYKKYLPIRLY